MGNFFRFWLFIGVCTLFSCSSRQQWEERFTQLDSQIDSLEMQERLANEAIDQLWDSTTQILEKQIPADFPEIDRDIFLKARNADHMTMFKSFKLLDSSTQKLVLNAKKEDEILAARMMDLMKKREKLENDKKVFLAAVAERDPKASKEYITRFQE